MKNNLSWFAHYGYSYRRPEFKMLRLRFGWEGEGRYYAIVCMIIEADNCLLSYKHLKDKLSIAAELGFTDVSELDCFVEYLISDLCGLLIFENESLTAEEIKEAQFLVQESRESARDRIRKYRERQKNKKL